MVNWRTRTWLWLVGVVLVMLFLLMCANVLYGPASEPRYGPLRPTPSPHISDGWYRVPDAGLRPYVGAQGG